MLSLAHMEINISIDKEFKKYIKSSWLRKIAKIVIAGESIGTDKLEMSLAITNDEQLHELNLKYLEEDRPTDVLSFPMNERPERSKRVGVDDLIHLYESLYPVGADDVIHLGDVIISYPTAARQAVEHNHAVEQEITILLIHGILHLLGYDHAEPDERRLMQHFEKRALILIKLKLNEDLGISRQSAP